MFVAVMFAAAAVAGPTPVCSKLSTDYDMAYRRLGYLNVQEQVDESVPRSQLYELQKQTALQRAAITLSLMGLHHCELPTAAPDEEKYFQNN